MTGRIWTRLYYAEAGVIKRNSYYSSDVNVRISLTVPLGLALSQALTNQSQSSSLISPDSLSRSSHFEVTCMNARKKQKTNTAKLSPAVVRRFCGGSIQILEELFSQRHRVEFDHSMVCLNFLSHNGKYFHLKEKRTSF